MDDPAATYQPYRGRAPSTASSTVRQLAQLTGSTGGSALVGMPATPQPVIDRRLIVFTI
jgi:hypothetical protein